MSENRWCCRSSGGCILAAVACLKNSYQPSAISFKLYFISSSPKFPSLSRIPNAFGTGKGGQRGVTEEFFHQLSGISVQQKIKISFRFFPVIPLKTDLSVRKNWKSSTFPIILHWKKRRWKTKQTGLHLSEKKVLFLGLPGVGKTHLAVGLAIKQHLYGTIQIPLYSNTKTHRRSGAFKKRQQYYGKTYGIFPASNYISKESGWLKRCVSGK